MNIVIAAAKALGWSSLGVFLVVIAGLYIAGQFQIASDRRAQELRDSFE